MTLRAATRVRQVMKLTEDTGNTAPCGALENAMWRFVCGPLFGASALLVCRTRWFHVLESCRLCAGTGVFEVRQIRFGSKGITLNLLLSYAS